MEEEDDNDKEGYYLAPRGVSRRIVCAARLRLLPSSKAITLSLFFTVSHAITLRLLVHIHLLFCFSTVVLIFLF